MLFGIDVMKYAKFVWACIVILSSFMFMGIIADKYMSCAMQSMCKKLKLSPALAAVTLIAFSNGAPDIITAVASSGENDNTPALVGQLFGAFLFGSTLGVANVIYNATGLLKLPKKNTSKELIFYLLSVIVICGFGLYGKLTYIFVIIYMSLYVLYIIISIYFDQEQN